jgi:putative lipoic acid-binding regulatory protein
MSAAAGAANFDGDDDADLPASGSFFYEVPPPLEGPPPDDDGGDAVRTGASSSSSSSSSSMMMGGEVSSASGSSLGGADDGMQMFRQIIQSTRVSGRGFSRTTSTTDHAARSIIQTTDKSKGSFVGIGRPLNDVRNPEYDENGYTLYADETTGEKRRVFEALVEYPSVFKMKIVGRDDVDEGRFASEMVGIVARSCGVDAGEVEHTERRNGKWTSVTVHAPVKDADMLYALYESVDKDPRVKFKF